MDIIVKASGNPKKLNAILEKLLEENRIRRCLERLPEFIDAVPEENVYDFILAFFNISDKISREREGDLDFGVEIQLVRLAYHLVKKLPANKRYGVLEKLVNNSLSVESPAHFVSIEKEEHDKEKDEKLIDKNELDNLVKVALTKIKEYAKSGQLSKSPGLAYLLFRWRDWENIDEPKKYVTELTKTPAGLSRLLKGFTAQSISRSGRRYVLVFKELKTFIDLKELKDKIIKVNKSEKKSMSKEELESFDSFLTNVDKAIAGQEDFF